MYSYSDTLSFVLQWYVFGSLLCIVWTSCLVTDLLTIFHLRWWLWIIYPHSELLVLETWSLNFLSPAYQKSAGSQCVKWCQCCCWSPLAIRLDAHDTFTYIEVVNSCISDLDDLLDGNDLMWAEFIRSNLVNLKWFLSSSRVWSHIIQM